MRRAFTLIELIFVIVIIGLLAAIAVPKFINLKQHTQANAVVKTAFDAAQQAVSAASDKYNLDNDSNFTLKDLVNVTGKGWEWNNNNNECYYTDPVSNKIVADIKLDTTNKDVTYSINCLNFADTTTQKYCERLINNRQTQIATLPY